MHVCIQSTVWSPAEQHTTHAYHCRSWAEQTAAQLSVHTILKEPWPIEVPPHGKWTWSQHCLSQHKFSTWKRLLEPLPITSLVHVFNKELIFHEYRTEDVTQVLRILATQCNPSYRPYHLSTFSVSFYINAAGKLSWKRDLKFPKPISSRSAPFIFSCPVIESL